ncbi:hypothetical protein [Adhaeribacter aquaticus]|uniref:hypothetical protein n=1 Tax=Adhaeribacter aquaticus TaxID=299567 RepID=UPI000401C830|nr:hypothetical protein [Adhaeribacter aquaticus]
MKNDIQELTEASFTPIVEKLLKNIENYSLKFRELKKVHQDILILLEKSSSLPYLMRIKVLGEYLKIMGHKSGSIKMLHVEFMKDLVEYNKSKTDLIYPTINCN